MLKLTNSYFLWSLFFLLIVAIVIPSARSEILSVDQLAKLIKHADPGVNDSHLWAQELTYVMDKHKFKRNRENCCAVIAIISQESGFVPNPPVANMGKLATEAVVNKLSKFLLSKGFTETVLEQLPRSDNSYMNMLRQAKTERDLDRIYRDLISDFCFSKSLCDTRMIRNLIEDMNDIDTIGSMQVSVKFAIQTEERWRGRKLALDKVWEVREWMYSLRGGMWYGVLRLLGYKTGYRRKIHRFADYNAGRYASRNAAFQHTVASLLGSELVMDGDLLIYGNNGKAASSTISNTERAINKVARKYRLDLTKGQIRGDLLKEKTWNFNKTNTYKAIRNQYGKLKKKQAPYAMIPSINLTSEKTSRILSTNRFAKLVNGRYQKCIRKSR